MRTLVFNSKESLYLQGPSNHFDLTLELSISALKIAKTMRCNPSGLTSHRPAATPVTRAALRDCTHHWLNAILKFLKILRTFEFQNCI